MISPRAWRWFPADCSATGASRPLREPLSSATRVVVFRLVVFQVAVSIDNPWVAAARGTPRHDPSLDADWVDGGLQTGAGSFNPVTCPTTRDVMKHQKQHNRSREHDLNQYIGNRMRVARGGILPLSRLRKETKENRVNGSL